MDLPIFQFGHNNLIFLGTISKYVIACWSWFALVAWVDSVAAKQVKGQYTCKVALCLQRLRTLIICQLIFK
jgi:hypothetical protein